MNKNERPEPAIQNPQSEQVDASGNASSRRVLSGCLILAGAAWGLHLFMSYSLVEWHCRTLALEHSTVRWILYLLTGGFFLTAATCTATSRKAAQKRAQHPEHATSSLFSLRFTTMLCGLLTAIIFAQGLPIVLVSVCSV